MPDPRLASILLVEKQLFITVGPNHKFVGRNSLSFKEIEKEPFVVGALDKTPLVRGILFNYFAQFKAHPVVSFEADDPATLNSLVSLGMGLGIDYSLPHIKLGRGLVRIPLTDLDVTVPVYLQWRGNNMNPVLARVLEIVSDISFVDH